ncbi:MAG: DNA repair protein RecN [Bacteroidales bacterium]|nr:DNA repair protein RecN [Bacteroidales bacterium]
MLQQLTIENYTLIQQLSISFNNGFTVITGETGAGKSILIGALSLILGQRADSNVLLDKDAKCIIEGLFYGKDYNLRSFFDHNDLDYDDSIVIRREITPAGKSRAFINDTPVNLNLVRELGEKLVDIHSQHAILALNDPAFQLSIADEYAGHNSLLKTYQAEYKGLQLLTNDLRHLQQDEINAKKDQDYLNFQLTEINKARLQPGEKEELEEQLEVQTHAEEIKTYLLQVKHLFSNEENSLLGKIAESASLLKKVSAYYSEGANLLQRLESVFIELKDIDQEINQLETSVVYEPEKLEQLNQRLSLIYQLEQKHHVSGIEELLRIASKLNEKLNNIVSLEDKIPLVKAEIAKKLDQLTLLNQQLSAGRQATTQLVSDELTTMVRQLGMPDAKVQLIIEPLQEPGPDGSEKVKLLFNANKGGNLKEVSSIASGGELSRLMLAVKYLLSSKKKLPTLIFDEIDVGISGEIAAKMGSMMLNMSKTLQLLTITHLPQIAGKASNHLLVYKESGDHATLSNIRTLNHEDRILEIAKMLSDENVSEISMMKAKELLE